ncbi:putative PPE family protein PPE42 [Mycobacterium attenuatum]|uniref:Putative PPE family protein PPE42 n=1 Tax=Mycobacterium attenuatum TaxID=2341086 RepID=A0A498Q4F2_9MYCO|nr:PPE family protein [Mycobacterium attenuatum]VBA41068.1 putative PPE family protein PPE42 [Mycobacterium attenuatum]
MNFSVLPPEITSAQMYTGAGSGPMLAAATSWAGLGDELGSAAQSFGSVTTGLAGGPWQGPASVAMTAVAGRYARWLQEAAARAVAAATQAKSVAGIFEAAKAAIAHPMTVRTNRMQFISAVRSNLLGLNGPLIAAIEGAYDELWAQNVTALVGYHGGASAVAAQLMPWQQALQNLGGLANQASCAVTGGRTSGGQGALGSAADVGGVIGRIVATDEAELAAVYADNVSQISSAAAVTRTALAAAAADLTRGELVPAVREVATAVNYDLQTAAHLVAEDAALPAQLVTDDLRILAGLPPVGAPAPAAPSSLEHYLAVQAARIAQVPGQIVQIDEALIAHVIGDNQSQICSAVSVTENGLRAAGLDVLAGQPIAAVNDVASALSYDAQVVTRLAVEDASLPMQLIREDIGVLAGLPPAAPAAALSPAEPSSLEHYLALRASQIAAIPGEIVRADGALIGKVLDDNQTAIWNAVSVTETDLGAAGVDLAEGNPVKAANDVAAAINYDVQTVTRLAAEDLALPIQLATTDAAIIASGVGGYGGYGGYGG